MQLLIQFSAASEMFDVPHGIELNGLLAATLMWDLDVIGSKVRLGLSYSASSHGTRQTDGPLLSMPLLFSLSALSCVYPAV